MKKLILKVIHTAGKWIFWAYDRKSWQYDVLCLIFILALIFIPVKGPQADRLKQKDTMKANSLVYNNDNVENIYLATNVVEYSNFENNLSNLKSVFIQILKNNKIFQGFSLFWSEIIE